MNKREIRKRLISWLNSEDAKDLIFEYFYDEIGINWEITEKDGNRIWSVVKDLKIYGRIR
jgi:hypothetical protein